MVFHAALRAGKGLGSGNSPPGISRDKFRAAARLSLVQGFSFFERASALHHCRNGQKPTHDEIDVEVPPEGVDSYFQLPQTHTRKLNERHVSCVAAVVVKVHVLGIEADELEGDACDILSRDSDDGEQAFEVG